MSLILIVSILIRLVALAWSLVLLRRLRDWRMGFLTAMLALMALRQTLSLLTESESWSLSVTGQLTELPGLLVSIAALLAVVFLGNILAERERAEESIRQYAEIVSHMQIGLFVYHLEEIDDDRTLRLILANPAAARLTGVPAEQVLNRTIDENFPGLRAKGIPHLFAEVVRSGNPMEVEEFEYGDSRVVQAAWSFKAFPLPNRCAGIALENITRRKRAEEALRASERLLAGILEIAADAVISADEAQRITLFNRGAEEIFGYRAEEALGKPLDILLPPRLAEAHRAHVRDFAASPTPARRMNERGAVFARRKDGTEFPAEASISKLEVDGEKIFTVMLRDTTERNRLEERLRLSQRMEAVGRLAGGVAHDFNNMLTAIVGYSDLLLTEFAHDDPGRLDVDEIRKAAERAASLTRQLLAFSRRQVLQPKVLDLNLVVADMEQMLRRLIGEDVELVSVLEPTLGCVKADPGQIEQVIVNLAVNARDAMPRGGKLTIETADAELDEAYARQHVAVVPGPYVMLAVSDTGTGMDPEIQDRIFEPFFTTKEKGEGSGLGLATVYGIVKQSGGNIWVYSEPGRGTTFKIYLPRVDEPAEPLPRREEPGSLPRGAETVLVVEDEPAVRELTARVLRGAGYTVLEAPGGEEALKWVESHRGAIHLLLTDAVMAGMSGRELAERIEATRPGTKVVYMSGYTDNAIVRHGLLEPGVALLQKPFTPIALARKVREVLDRPGEGPP